MRRKWRRRKAGWMLVGEKQGGFVSFVWMEAKGRPGKPCRISAGRCLRTDLQSFQTER